MSGEKELREATMAMKVYSSPDWMLVQTLRSVLESYEIPCEVRGEYRSSAAGEIPTTESWSELWVLGEDRAAEAREVLARMQHEPRQDLPAWTCPTCHERIEGQFDRCWKCAAPR